MLWISREGRGAVAQPLERWRPHLDGGNSFALPVKVSSGSVRNDQDARVVVDNATGYAYVTFDNSIQGGKGTAMFVSVSKDHGATWSNSLKFATFQNPVSV